MGDNNIILLLFLCSWVEGVYLQSDEFGFGTVFEGHSLKPEKTQVWIPNCFWPYYLPICDCMPVESYMISLSLSFFTCKIGVIIAILQSSNNN